MPQRDDFAAEGVLRGTNGFAAKPFLPGKTPSAAKSSLCGITRAAHRKKITSRPTKDTVGKMLRHLLIFLLVMKESNMPGADVCSCPLTSVCRCNQGLTSIPENLPRPTYSLDLSYNQITIIQTGAFGKQHDWSWLIELRLNSNKITTIQLKKGNLPSWFSEGDNVICAQPPKFKGQKLLDVNAEEMYEDIDNYRDQTGKGQSQAINESNTNTAVSEMTSGDDHQYEDIDNHHDQTGQGQSQAFTESNIHTMTSGDDHQYEDIDNHHIKQRGHCQTRVETPPNDQTSTEMACGHDQTGQAQSQDNIQSIRFGNLSLDDVLAALRPNPMYAGVETPPNDQTSTEMACGHDQTGQAQSQDNIQSIRFGNLSLDDVLAALRPNPMYAGVETPPNDQTSTEMACGHDQKGQDQSQTNIQSVKLENLSLDEVLAAFRPHSMHARVETPPNHPASTEMASGHGETGQAQAQIQSIRFGNLSLNEVIAALRPNYMHAGVETPPNHPASTEMASGHDQTGQGQSHTTTESLDARNFAYGSGPTVSQVNSLYAKGESQ
ncbi:Bax inhibitor 1 [Branchiostoma belcheri]|nr:Bax inhibitor 1 [Branchiostoma belcheri]